MAGEPPVVAQSVLGRLTGPSRVAAYAARSSPGMPRRGCIEGIPDGHVAITDEALYVKAHRPIVCREPPQVTRITPGYERARAPYPSKEDA